jgi:hypothetical protein
MAKTRLGREDFDTWCRQHGEDPADALHEESFHGLIAYEEILRHKHGWRVRAIRTWMQIKKMGLIRSTEARVLNGRGVGFKSLMERGERDLTDEHLVTKYPTQFSEKAVRKAKDRLSAWDRAETVT